MSLADAEKALRALGADLVRVDTAVHRTRTGSLPFSLHQLRTVGARSGDSATPLCFRDGDRWLQVEWIASEADTHLFSVVDRTEQIVSRQARGRWLRRETQRLLAASTAREMNDAMTIVQGRLELLEAVAGADPGVARHTTIALEHSQRLADALHNLRLVGAIGLIARDSLDMRAVVEHAVESIDARDRIQIDVASGLVVTGQRGVVNGLLIGTLRAVCGADQGRVSGVVDGETIRICVRGSGRRGDSVDGLPLGIVEALVDVVGGDLEVGRESVELVLPRKLEERGLFRKGATFVLAVGTPVFTDAVRSTLAPDIEVVEAAGVGMAKPADHDVARLQAVVSQVLLEDGTALELVRAYAEAVPGVPVVLVSAERLEQLPEPIPSLHGPLDRARLIRAVTGG